MAPCNFYIETLSNSYGYGLARGNSVAASLCLLCYQARSMQGTRFLQQVKQHSNSVSNGDVRKTKTLLISSLLFSQT